MIVLHIIGKNVTSAMELWYSEIQTVLENFLDRVHTEEKCQKEDSYLEMWSPFLSNSEEKGSPARNQNL